MKKYNLDLVASTFLIIDSNEASMQVLLGSVTFLQTNPTTPQIACEWQKCIGDTINLVSPLQCG